jgi:flagellum-specific peptidoglycan hydrolase FlgJ
LNQQVANENFDSFFAKGWAVTWNQMGNGNWATDPNYSQKVMKVYAGMVAYAPNA